MHEGVFGAKGEWFKRSLCRKVWNEKGTLFWKDGWVEGGLLKT